MNYLQLATEQNIFVITMIDDANNNTFTMEMIKEYNQVFDEIESFKGNAAMVITSSHPKMWCNGINLQWFSEQTEEMRNTFLYEFKKIFLRASLLNLPTIGCLTGHCFAGGAILACSMDFRTMKNEKARFCLPEVNYAMPLGDTLIAVINNIPNKYAVNYLVLTGRQLPGSECLAHGLAIAIYPMEELFAKTLEFAKELAGKSRANYTGLKYDIKPHLLKMWQEQNIK